VSTATRVDDAAAPAPGALTRLLDHLGTWARPALVANLVGQMAIIVTGGFVRLTGSGLGCETWPECHPGSFTPIRHAETGYHQAIEFGNRVVTIVLCVIAAYVAVVVWRRRDRVRSVRWLGLAPLLGVVAQAVIGGIVVLFDLPPTLVGVHLLVSMTLVWLSMLLLVRWGEADTPPHRVVDPGTWTLSRALGVVLVPVLVLGVVVTGAGPHGGDDVHAERLSFDPEVVARLHAGVVWVFLVLLVWLLWRTHRFPTPQRVRRGLLVVLGVTLLQGVVGYVQYFTGLPIGLVAIHMLGAASLTAATTWALLTMRERKATAVAPSDDALTAA
jgi:cytochrome c oxidase assembly protein subunit 15